MRIVYFFRKLGKMSDYLSSAAVVIGTLRVEIDSNATWKIINIIKIIKITILINNSAGI